MSEANNQFPSQEELDKVAAARVELECQREKIMRSGAMRDYVLTALIDASSVMEGYGLCFVKLPGTLSMFQVGIGIPTDKMPEVMNYIQEAMLDPEYATPPVPGQEMKADPTPRPQSSNREEL